MYLDVRAEYVPIPYYKIARHVMRAGKIPSKIPLSLFNSYPTLFQMRLNFPERSKRVYMTLGFVIATR